MRLRRFIPELLLLGSTTQARPTDECPDGVSIVKVQPEVIVGLQPVSISAVFTSNTVLTIDGTTIPITGAPTTLVTAFTITKTSTRYITGNPEPYFTGPYTTITSNNPGSNPTTITRPPSGNDHTGTVIIVNPSGGSGGSGGTRPAFTGPYTTITNNGPAGSHPTTLTLPPSGNDPSGTVIVVVPSGTGTQSKPFTGPYTTITSAGPGSQATTLTLPPSGTGALFYQLR
ncbi:Uncharacterized protein LW94_13094 [Fusarium fujikuroi]|nr:Uncharacterized protein LW94_13094 [Fusarium fujikuroi]